MNLARRLAESLRTALTAFMDRMRLRLAQPDALIHVTALGLLAGLVAAGFSVAFRLLLETAQTYGLGLPHADRFEALPLEWRFALPVLGGILLGLVFQMLPMNIRHVGIGHVIIRFHRFEAELPWRNAMVQFFGGITALLAGLSGGREGPGIHLGAFGGSLIGRSLGLPNNSIRTLAGCGVAAAIAASFNTPLAAVIFALEVIVKQYTLASFIPVILASSAGALLASLFFGSNPAFDIHLSHSLALWEVPFLIVLGLLIGLLATSFIQIVESTISRTWRWPVWLRFTTGGLLVGLLALVLPEVMGIGYDTINLAADAKIALTLLALIVVGKLVASGLTVGIGLPVGAIAPTLVVGAATGGTLGTLLWHYQQIPLSDVAFYTVLGMGAMMGATLQAPLAALTAVLELTTDTEAILPAMITIVVASLTSRVVFGKDGIYDAILRANDQQTAGPSLWYSGDDIAIGSIIERNFRELPQLCDIEELQATLAQKPRWLIIRDEHRHIIGVSQPSQAQTLLDKTLEEKAQEEKAREDLAQTGGAPTHSQEDDTKTDESESRGFDDQAAPKDQPAEPAATANESGPSTAEPETLEVPPVKENPEENPPAEMEPEKRFQVDLAQGGRFYSAKLVDVGVTATHALRQMKTDGVEVLVAQRVTVPPFARIHGVLTRAMLEQAIVGK